MHGLTKGVWNAFGEFVRRDVVGTRGSGPAEFEGAIHDAGAPCSREIAEIASVLGLACGVALLDKGPKAFSIDEKVAATAMVISNESDFGVVGYPFGKTRELGGVIQVSVDREHRVIRRRQVEGGDVDGVGRVLRQESVPGTGTGGNIDDLPFIDFAVNEGKGGSARREWLLGRCGAGQKGTVEATIVLEFGKGVFQGAIIV
jgi:hypothetical protein